MSSCVVSFLTYGFILREEEITRLLYVLRRHEGESHGARAPRVTKQELIADDLVDPEGDMYALEAMLHGKKFPLRVMTNYSNKRAERGFKPELAFFCPNPAGEDISIAAPLESIGDVEFQRVPGFVDREKWKVAAERAISTAMDILHFNEAGIERTEASWIIGLKRM
ncbi:hypothetical protein BDQ12DRAFT_113864 [Crucibulum laeve]|uniref:Uncharacterized protein n=1 Tax=Crucibulum laeve TaxID=68775 RepID=A0A5C3M1A5_9AGAR|nr:hypothetical protein BDQ12DRAFT_113864 [Crucibulum laeve]